MQLIILSDTHGKYQNLEKIVLKHPDAAYYLHLGDGEGDCGLFLQNHPELEDRFLCVKGNCDYGIPYEQTLLLDLMPGHRLLATHGHRYYVHQSLEFLTEAARDNGCDIALYGHTHQSRNTYLDGVTVMNPGSASCPRDGNPPSYGILDVSTQGVLGNIVFL